MPPALGLDGSSGTGRDQCPIPAPWPESQPGDPGRRRPGALAPVLRGARLARATRSPRTDVVFFQSGGHGPRDCGIAGELAKDSGVEDGGGWGGVTLAYNVHSPAEVDAFLERARAAGAGIPRGRRRDVLGRLLGRVRRPGRAPWEVAHNPFWTVTDEATSSFRASDLRPRSRPGGRRARRPRARPRRGHAGGARAPGEPRPAGGPAKPDEDGLWSPQRRPLTLGLVMTITLVAAEALAVSTAMPIVARELGGQELYGLVFSAFLVGSLHRDRRRGQPDRPARRRPPVRARAVAVRDRARRRRRSPRRCRC